MFAGGGEPSGSGGGGSSSFNQLAMFHMANANNGTIDWAALAIQWMQMRENNMINTDSSVTTTAAKPFEMNAFASIPQPPPPPIINTNQDFINTTNKSNKLFIEEKGEADMDMDDETEYDNQQSASGGPTNVHLLNTTRPMTGAENPGHSRWRPSNQMSYHENVQQRKPGNNNRGQESNSWNSSSWKATNPSKPIMNKNKPFHSQNQRPIPSLMNILVPPPTEIKETPDNDGNIPQAVMDAAKRKVLPAWIREGLEKMEREKQKQMERGHTVNPKTDEILDKSEIKLHDTVKEVDNKGSLTANQNESSGNEEDLDGDNDENDNGSNVRSSVAVSSRTQIHSSDSEDDENAPSTSTAAAAVTRKTQETGKSYEQKLDDLMIDVRRTLTELLLAVTNEQISKIAHETLKAQKLKATSAQVIRKSALSSITNKLGLAAYSSSSDEEASDDERERKSSRGGAGSVGNRSGAEDSEEEIKTILRQKRRAFAKTADEIEERIAGNELREEQKLKYYKEKEAKPSGTSYKTRSSDDDDDDDDQSPDEGYKRSSRNTKRSSKNYKSNENDDSNDSDHEKRSMKKQAPSLFPSMAAASGVGGGGGGKNYKLDFGETPTDSYKMQPSNGKRQKSRTISSRRERTTRFSDNKDSNKATPASGLTSLIGGHLQFQQPQHSATAISSNATVTAAPANLNFPASSFSAISSNKPPDDSTESRNTDEYFLSSTNSTGLKNALSAAEAALEKATQSRSSEKRKKSYRDSSDSSDRHERRRSRERDRDRDHQRHRRRGRDYSREREKYSRVKPRDSSSSSSESEKSSKRRRASRSYSKSRSRSADCYSKSSNSSRRRRRREEEDYRRQHSSSSSYSRRKRDRNDDHSDDHDDDDRKKSKRSQNTSLSSRDRREDKREHRRPSRRTHSRSRSRSHASTASSTSHRRYKH